MDFDGLITIAGLFIAIIAILPRSRRLELSIKFGLFGKISIGIFLLSIVYLQFYQLFRTMNFTPGFNLARWNITTKNVSAFLIIAETIILLIYFRINGVNRFSIRKYRDYIYQLIEERRYNELFCFLEDKMDKINKIYSLEHTHFSGTKEAPLNKNIISKVNLIMKKIKNEKIIIDDIYGSIISYSIRKPRIKTTYATEIIQELTRKRKVVDAILEYKPYFAIELLKFDFWENQDFVDIILSSLSRDTISILYDELKNTTNITSTYEFVIPHNMRFLFFLFHDCSIAEKYGVYKPIGDFVINYLDDLRFSGKVDLYNEPMRDFDQKGKWESELFLGIHFFERMIGAAIAQNIKWHMWLYYFPYFVERILKNLVLNHDLIDLRDEWPTKYHYAIYEIISCLLTWITSVLRIDINQENVKLEETNASHENGNIPKSSMIALGQILKEILLSEKISFDFQKYIMDMVFRGYFELKRNEETIQFAYAFRECIATAGDYYNLPKSYSQILMTHIENADIAKFDIYDYKDMKEYLLRSNDHE